MLARSDCGCAVLGDAEPLTPDGAGRESRIPLWAASTWLGITLAYTPRAATPERRIEALRQLAQAGIPSAVMVAPIIPGLNDEEIEAIIARCADAGAGTCLDQNLVAAAGQFSHRIRHQANP